MSEIIVDLDYNTYKIIVKNGGLDSLVDNLNDHLSEKNVARNRNSVFPIKKKQNRPLDVWFTLFMGLYRGASPFSVILCNNRRCP